MYDKTVRRRRAVLGLLVVSSLILLTAYFGERAGGPLHSVQRGILEVVSPIQEGASRALKPVRDLFGWVGDTVSAKGDLKKTRDERDMWRAQAIRNEAAVRQNAQLRGLVDLGGQIPGTVKPYAPVSARVIGRSPTLWYGRIQIDKGSSDGLAPDMPVIASDGTDQGAGLIGKVETVSSNVATVVLITDAAVSVGARTVENTANGLVTPKVGNPRDLILQDTSKNDQATPGQVVVTSGTVSRRADLASVYPGDIPIGKVTKINDPGTDDQEIHLRPFVDPRKVEFVQVLTRRVNGNR